MELARSLELRSGAYHAPALPVELYQRSWRGDSNADHGLTRPALFLLSYTSTKRLHDPGGGGENCTPDDLLCRQTPCCLGYTASNLLTKSGAEGGTRTRALDIGNVASWPLDDFRMERAARVELASSGWRPEAPAAIPCSLLAGDEGLEPSYLDLETSVLAAGRISRKLMAELTGVEPVPADRRSAILPIDHSSGSLPWTRTTISAFRAQRPTIGRRGNMNLSKNWLPGSDSNARTWIQSPE